jgi:putative DNA primase/helicase
MSDGNLVRDIYAAVVQPETPAERERASRRLQGTLTPTPDAWEGGGDWGDPMRSGEDRSRVLTLAEFLSLEVPEREPLLVLADGGDAVLRQKDLAMLFARRGVGKTWATLGLAVAVGSGGSFLRWRAPKARRVLLVDGEMSAGALQERLRLLLQGRAADLSILCADLLPNPMPSLAAPAGQAFVDAHLEGVEFLCLDNISTLFGSAAENDSDEWEPAQRWLLSLRRRGVTVLLDHHSGRAGNPRGTSRREDVLDIVLALRHPTDYAPDQGARFEVHFDKSRGLTARAAESFEARLQGGEWTLGDVKGRQYEQAVELFGYGAKPHDVAAELGISRATAYRYKERAATEGRLADKGSK